VQLLPPQAPIHSSSLTTNYILNTLEHAAHPLPHAAVPASP
jgi:hypothetical protein